MQSRVREIRRQFDADLAAAKDAAALGEIRLRYLGRKAGLLTLLLRDLKQVDPSQRAAAGRIVNDLKRHVSQSLGEIADRHRGHASAPPGLDLSLPGRVQRPGIPHPITQVRELIEEIFLQMGYSLESGPEAETDYYNFEALNIPAMHPARDMQDTFWLANGWLLRTHTSPCQVRAMERLGPPLRVIAPGRCFRYETEDASHANTFHQVEGLMIDRNISIANLIAVMKLILSEIFHHEVRVRLRPGYFPFVEPGFEMDMGCEICGGTGCPTCKKSGWIEILPCGMVHPNVLRFGRIDPHEYTGFAFGLGLTRLAMMKYGVRDIRVLNSGDLRAIIRPEQRNGAAIVEKDGRDNRT